MRFTSALQDQLLSNENLLFLYTPRPRKPIELFVVDPETAMAALQAAKALLDANNFANWQADVTAKLNVISDKLDTILQELRDLKVWISDALDEEARKMWSATIESNRAYSGQCYRRSCWRTGRRNV